MYTKPACFVFAARAAHDFVSVCVLFAVVLYQSMANRTRARARSLVVVQTARPHAHKHTMRPARTPRAGHHRVNYAKPSFPSRSGGAVVAVLGRVRVCVCVCMWRQRACGLRRRRGGAESGCRVVWGLV